MYSILLTTGVQLGILMYMKPITEYNDYRQYIQEYYDERKLKSAFTWREFAARAGFSSPVYLKDVCSGKKSLSAVAVEKVANAMSLTGFELTFFRALVAFCHAKNDSDKKQAVEQMHAIAAANKVKIMGADEFAYFDSWKNPVIREIAPAMPGAKPLEIAHKCYQKITAAEVTDTLQFLTRTGMLQKDEQGNYSQTDKVVTTSVADFVPLALRNMHRQMANFALDALDNIPLKERQFSGMTLGISLDAYDRILKELADCRQKITVIANECQSIEKVYRLNMQMFPLTQDLTTCEENRNGGNN